MHTQTNEIKVSHNKVIILTWLETWLSHWVYLPLLKRTWVLSPGLILSDTRPPVTSAPWDLVPCHDLFSHLHVYTHILTQSFTDINTQCIITFTKVVCNLQLIFWSKWCHKLMTWCHFIVVWCSMVTILIPAIWTVRIMPNVKFARNIAYMKSSFLHSICNAPEYLTFPFPFEAEGVLLRLASVCRSNGCRTWAQVCSLCIV